MVVVPPGLISSGETLTRNEGLAAAVGNAKIPTKTATVAATAVTLTVPCRNSIQSTVRLFLNKDLWNFEDFLPEANDFSSIGNYKIDCESSLPHREYPGNVLEPWHGSDKMNSCRRFSSTQPIVSKTAAALTLKSNHQEERIELTSDKALGAVILAGSILGIIVYGGLLIYLPLLVLEISAFLAVALLAGILGWIGWTMATTPPPEPLPDLQSGTAGLGSNQSQVRMGKEDNPS